MLRIVSIIFMALPMIAAAAPQQFKTVTALMDEYNDYSTDAGTFKVISKVPLKIQISPKVFSGDSDKAIEVASYKASVYAAYRTLLQTPAKEVNITIVPLSFNLSKQEKSYLKDKQYSFSLTKEKALKLAHSFAGTANPDEIIGNDGYEWTDNFSSCCYLESGHPGVVKFAHQFIK